MPTKTPRRSPTALGNGGKFPANAFQDFNAATTNWSAKNALALAWASNLAYQADATISSVAAQWLRSLTE
jgi:hypothetical protein